MVEERFLNRFVGFFKLEEDDILFVRSIHAPATGEQDVAVCWVTGE